MLHEALMSDSPAHDDRDQPAGERPPRLDTSRPFKDLKRQLVDEFERTYLLHLLDEQNNLTAAMRSSGLSRRHLRTLLRKHGHYERIVRERIAKLMGELS